MKRLYFLGILLCLGSPFITLSKHTAVLEEDSIESKDFDNYDVLLSWAAKNKTNGEPKCTDFDLVDNLIHGLDAAIILKHSLYKRSNSILNRSLHDLPTFTWTCVDNDCLTLAALPFYNQTTKMYFTKCNPYINSYLAISGAELIKDLEKGIDGLLDIPTGKILPLFNNITLQERRLGIYFRAASNYGPWTFQFSLPFLYLERNFFLTEKDQKKIEHSPFLREFATGSNKTEAQAFLKPHLVADKLGFSDLRIHALYTPYEGDRDRFTIGGFMTFPTAFAITQGLVGGSFCKRGGIPAINLKEQLEVAFKCTNSVARKVDSFEQINRFLLSIIDRLTANVAETSLGNNGHLTLGPLFEYEHRLNPYWSVTTQANVQYVVPNNEIRGYIQVNDPNSFNRDFASKDPKEVAANLKFLEDKIFSDLFLSPLKTRVQPGVITQANTYLTFTPYECITCSLGYDFWYQSKEKLTLKEFPPLPVYVHKAINPAGLQHKVFGSALGAFPFCDGLLQYGLRGDYTFASRGIGKDFTLAFDIEYLY